MKTSPASLSCQSSRLITLSGPAFSARPPIASDFGGFGADASALLPLLSAKNGFAAWLGALTVMSSDPETGPLSMVALNAGDWRKMSGAVDPDMVFFAADLAGCLFGLQDGQVIGFDPDCDAVQVVAGSVGAWQDMVVADPDGMAGYGVALAARRAGLVLDPGCGLVTGADGGFEQCQIGLLVSRKLAARTP